MQIPEMEARESREETDTKILHILPYYIYGLTAYNMVYIFL